MNRMTPTGDAEIASQRITSADALIERAIQVAREGRKKTVAVAAAQDADVIGAVAEANADGFLDGILVGDREKIEQLASEQKIDIGNLRVVNEVDPMRAAHAAVKFASDGEAQVMMKGFIPTSALLKTVLDKQYNLRQANTLSHCAVLDIPGYHKLLNFTDGGMVPAPDTEQRMQILENALLSARALGLSPVKVAVTGGVEASAFARDAQARFDDCIIQGPLSLDLATSKEAGELKGATGPVIGDADVYLVNSIEEGNIVAKSLIQFANAIFAGVIVGASVPVSLVSRTDTIKNKKASLAISAVLADYYEQHNVWKREA